MRMIHTAIVVACWLSLGHAQGIRLYDRSKDDAAQQALEAARKVAGGSLFEAEMKNLDMFAKLEVESTFSGEARVRSNFLNEIAVGTWRGVSILVASLDAQLDPDPILEKIAVLEAERDRLQRRFDTLNSQKAAPEPAVPDSAQTVADLIAGGIDADRAAASLPGGQEAIDLLGKALAEGQTAAGAIAANQKNVTDTAAQLQLLRLSLNSLAMDRVKVELDHQKTLLKIWQRAADDIKQTKSLIAEYERLSAPIDRGARVLDTLLSRADAARHAAAADLSAKRNELDEAVRLSFIASSIAARWNSAALVAQLREAHAKHLYSIQRSRLDAHAFEVAVGSGAQRLAIFYKGGVHPETIAQILYAAATASISATVAVTK